MPRNSSGTYTLPAGNPVEPNTVIETEWGNNTLEDIGNEITNSLSRTGEGGMQAPLRFTSGTAGVPGIAWQTETSSGFYRADAGEFWATVLATPVAQYTSNGVLLPNTVSLTVQGDQTIGGTLGVTGLLTASGGISGTIDTDNATITGGTINGTVIGGVTPAAGSFTTLSASGAFLLTGDQVQIAEGGTGATTASGARTNLGLVIGTDIPSPTGTGASGTWNIGITGNAATVTNGVVTSGSYADPAWITSLAGSKISGNIPGSAAGLTSTLAIASGGTGATTASGARTALDVPSNTGSGASGTWGISVSGNAGTATTWATGRTIALTGDVTGTSGTFDGSANLSFAATLANSGVVSGTYTKVTVDAKGRVTTGASLSAGDIPTLDYMFRSSSAQTDPNVQFNSSAYRFDPNANNPTNDYYSIITYGNQNNTVAQLATHDPSGETFTRAYSSTWGAWRKQLDSSNYNSYSPTLTGTGASGTWGINVTGNAGGLTGANVIVGASASDTLTINSTITSNLIFTDNTYDIGASGSTRPRNLFLAGSATVGGTLSVGGYTAVQSRATGYASYYRAIQVGVPSSETGNVALAVDVNAIAGTSFAGQNQVFVPRNGFLMPNAAGTNFIGVLASDSNNSLLIGTSTNAGVTTGTVIIDTSNTVGIGVTPSAGGGVLQLSGGITFPASQAASANANTLDDYEEGTWTPTASVNGFTQSISSLSGVYTKIGRFVQVQMTVNLSASGRPTSYSQFGGLPFSATDAPVGVFAGINPGTGIQGGSLIASTTSVFWYATNGATDSGSWHASIGYMV